MTLKGVALVWGPIIGTLLLIAVVPWWAMLAVVAAIILWPHGDRSNTTD